MREREKELFDELLKVIAEKRNDFPETKDKIKLTAFSAVQGPNYSKDGSFMVVGRAANQWAIGWLPDKVASAEGRKEILDDVYIQGEDKKLFTSDVWGDEEQYNTHKSAFWRVTELVTKELQIVNAEGVWRDHLIYSNLYKISPFKGGNPSDKLCATQERLCSELLMEELAQWTPKRVLFLTGMKYWAKPFTEYLRVETRGHAETMKHVEYTGKLFLPQSGSTSNIVVAQHPQGKKGGEIEIVNEIKSAFGKLENA